jgi:hypothetical protein
MTLIGTTLDQDTAIRALQLTCANSSGTTGRFGTRTRIPLNPLLRILPRGLIHHRHGIRPQIAITRVGFAAFEPGFWRQMPRPPTAQTGMAPVRLFTIAQIHEFHAALTLRAAERLVVTRDALEFR